MQEVLNPKNEHPYLRESVDALVVGERKSCSGVIMFLLVDQLDQMKGGGEVREEKGLVCWETVSGRLGLTEEKTLCAEKVNLPEGGT